MLVSDDWGAKRDKRINNCRFLFMSRESYGAEKILACRQWLVELGPCELCSMQTAGTSKVPIGGNIH
jgi:hypothetical protein